MLKEELMRIIKTIVGKEVFYDVYVEFFTSRKDKDIEQTSDSPREDGDIFIEKVEIVLEDLHDVNVSHVECLFDIDHQQFYQKMKILEWNPMTKEMWLEGIR
jgi:hypothetical protein